MLGFLEKPLGWCSLLIASGFQCDRILKPHDAGEREGMTWLEGWVKPQWARDT